MFKIDLSKGLERQECGKGDNNEAIPAEAFAYLTGDVSLQVEAS